MTTYLIESEITDEGLFRATAYEAQPGGHMSLVDIAEADVETVALDRVIGDLPTDAVVAAKCAWHVYGARKYGKFFGVIPEYLDITGACEILRKQSTLN